ncbi:OLC1v1032131C1 [Oldenlandia corymbosa var. corymbosa]|uniref:OLC1v1032131C1 n=1 Tax=Oldenlandia corymbosa var. corymbosa TaxID=529605 RepID=A0AAV1CNE5_OLDCO|nr:OLC1v1032131C1 [Oldenlandia corymbosa var. corymbosa]
MAAIFIMMEPYLQTLLNVSCTLIFLLYCFFIYYNYCVWSLKKNGKIHTSLPINWPVVGMLPALLRNAHRLHEYGTEILIESGGTYEFKGPWFANLDMVLTCDPANIHYILSKNFSNYPKGPEFRKIFEILGDGIFNADWELWEVHRKVTLSIMHHPNFLTLLEKTLLEKLEKGLLPILENYSNSGAEIDLQDIFQRLTFDSISRLVLDYDPNSLSMDLPNIPCEKAFNQTVEALLQRHILPETCWKLQKWMKFGKEKKLSEAWDAFDQFIYPCIDRKQQQLSCHGNSDEQYDCLTAFITAYESAMKNIQSSSSNTKSFLRDVFLNLMLAGRDTTSTALTWLFFLLTKNPSVESKILQEITETKKLKKNEPMLISTEDARKMVYLHGALCETLRLYPSVALEHKSPAKSDVLPSGLSVNPNSKLVLFFYSMGRMESIWGKECLEFQPERWISETGKIRHEPSFKFPAFNAGPRTCLGKEMSFVQMKMVAASIIYSYHVRLVDSHPVSPSDSIIIQMKHGLKVVLSKRKI